MSVLTIFSAIWTLPEPAEPMEMMNKYERKGTGRTDFCVSIASMKYLQTILYEKLRLFNDLHLDE